MRRSADRSLIVEKNIRFITLNVNGFFKDGPSAGRNENPATDDASARGS
jgi:hypothetical protein